MKYLAQSTTPWILLLTLCSIAAVLSSCSSQQSVREGHALLEIDRQGKSQARINRPEFVALNGQRINPPQQHLHILPGSQELTIRFTLNGQGRQEAKLRFKARTHQRYSVMFDPYPPADGGKINEEDGIWTGSEIDGFLFIPNMIGIAGYNVAEEISDRNRDIKWAYIRVISSDVTEGIVEQVRVP